MKHLTAKDHGAEGNPAHSPHHGLEDVSHKKPLAANPGHNGGHRVHTTNAQGKHQAVSATHDHATGYASYREEQGKALASAAASRANDHKAMMSDGDADD